MTEVMVQSDGGSLSWMKIGSSAKVLVTITAETLCKKQRREGAKNSCTFVVTPLIPEVFPLVDLSLPAQRELKS